MGCFWTRGYEATSVRNLAGEMGITGASLYNAFGDKRALYRRALDHYVLGMRRRVACLETQPPHDALRGFFDDIVARSATDPHHRGCMLVNAALEVPPDDTSLRTDIAGELAFIEAFFRRCILAGQAAGTMSLRQSADALAHMLLCVLLGIRVLARASPDRALLDGAVGAALAALSA